MKESLVVGGGPIPGKALPPSGGGIVGAWSKSNPVGGGGGGGAGKSILL